MEPSQIVERVWPDRPRRSSRSVAASPTATSGSRSDETFVLRIGGEDTQLLGIDRESEHEPRASR